MKTRFFNCLLKYFFTSFIPVVCFANGSSSLNAITEAFKNGTSNLEFRLRYENLKQQNLNDSSALTLRSVLGFQTAKLEHTALNIELTDVATLGGMYYNPGPGNFFNKSRYSLIPDAPGAGITQGKLIFNGIKSNTLVAGRQYIQLDNERFVGKVNWRQYPQSFDAFSIKNTYIKNLELFYAYAFQVDTTYGNNSSIPSYRRSLTTSFIHGAFSGIKYTTINCYIYLNDDHNVAINSNVLYGMRITSKENNSILLDYTLEYALQHGMSNNPSRYSAYYAHARLGKTIDNLSGALAFEILSGSATSANQYLNTVYASKHNFNGYAGVFNRTPNQGLQDYFATIAYRYKIIKATAIFHYFLLDKSLISKRAGQELDITLDIAITKQLVVNIGCSNYVRSVYAAPSTKDVWIMFTADLL